MDERSGFCVGLSWRVLYTGRIPADLTLLAELIEHRTGREGGQGKNKALACVMNLSVPANKFMTCAAWCFWRRHRMKPLVPVLLLTAAVLTGCASVANTRYQVVRIQTLNADGEIIPNARCALVNERGKLESLSGDRLPVHRSIDDLHIQCQHPAHPMATGRAISRINGWMVSNVFVVLGLGAILDYSLGTGYTYPGWMQLVFGQHLVFDRKDEQTGVPVPGKPEAPENSTHSFSPPIFPTRADRAASLPSAPASHRR